MFNVNEVEINSIGKRLFTLIGATRYIIGVFMAYWGSLIFIQLGQVYKDGFTTSISGADCAVCPQLLKESAVVIGVMGAILLLMGWLEKTLDYIPAGLIWILSGIYYYFPSLHPYKNIVIGIYPLLFIWWIYERNKDRTRLLGNIQIFMPLSLAAVIFTDDITMWLFSIFIALAFEGVYLAMQGASEISFIVLMGVEKEMKENTAVSFLKTLMSILKAQVSTLWVMLGIVLLDAFATLGHIHILKTMVRYGYILTALVYFLTWVWMGISMGKVHKAFSISILSSLTIILLSIIVKYTQGNTFLAILGIITGISILAQIGPVYEYFVRKYTSTIMFNVYIDHVSIIVLFTLLAILSYDARGMSIMNSVSPFLLTILGTLTKMFFIAFLMDTTINVIGNIKYAFRPPEEGGYERVV